VPQALLLSGVIAGQQFELNQLLSIHGVLKNLQVDRLSRKHIGARPCLDVVKIAEECLRGGQHFVGMVAPKVCRSELSETDGGQKGDHQHQAHGTCHGRPPQKKADDLSGF